MLRFRSIAIICLLPCFAAAQQGPDASNPLAGVIDFHCHVAPDAIARPLTEFDLVRIAKRAGMRGIVIKSHYLPTADRAQIVMQELDGVEVFGGIALNRSVGGINPDAVQKMIQIDGHRGKIVWLPTFDAENQIRLNNSQGPFVPIVRDGKPVPELIEIFGLVARNDLVLATGHSSVTESLIVIEAAKQAGVKKLLVTHAMSDPVGASEEQLRQLANTGAILECVYLNIVTAPPGTKRRLITVSDYARMMKSIGAEHFIISSDLGQQLNPVHVDGMLAFIRGLKAEGITDAQIDLMARKNPARLLGLAP